MWPPADFPPGNVSSPSRRGGACPSRQFSEFFRSTLGFRPLRRRALRTSWSMEDGRPQRAAPAAFRHTTDKQHGGQPGKAASGKLKVDTHKAGECLLFSYLLK